MASVLDSINNLDKITSRLNLAYRQNDILQHFNQQNWAAIQAITPSTGEVMAAELATRNLNLINSMNLDFTNQFAKSELLDTLSLQWDAISKASQVFQTPAITELTKNLLANDLTAGIQAFMPSVLGNIIEAPNLAFLKSASIFSDLSSADMPRGLRSIIKNTHTRTAKKLGNSDNVSVNVENRCFFDEANPENAASVQETNILCAAMDLFPDISEIDLIAFLNHIAKHPFFAIEHTVGKQIHESIVSTRSLIGFDTDCYYHARSLEKGACPYTEAQLSQAPHGVTWHGRYNHIGESHYYFSDKPKGAITEVRKHSPRGSRIQIAKIEPRQKIAMLDLSQINAPNKFLEYCRFSPRDDDYSKVKREYLIPCFVAGCCKLNGIEGIRYYGSKEYTNYVSWSDHFFECVGFELVEPDLEAV